MKKLFAILIAIAMVLSTNSLAFAAFTQDGIATYSASASPTTGTGRIVTIFSAALKNISGAAPDPATITWSSVEAQGTDWKSANQYIAAQGFETYTLWGIQIYTNNKGSGASPAYTGVAGTNPAGLVRTDDTTKTLPMCWRMVADRRLASGSIDLKIEQKYIATGPAKENYVLLRQDLPNPVPLPTELPPGDDYISDTLFFAPWGWMLDMNTPGKFQQATTPVLYDKYALVVSNYGVTVAPGNPDVAGSGTYLPIPAQTSVYNIYLGAKFINATGGKTYSTNKLTVEMYHL